MADSHASSEDQIRALLARYAHVHDNRDVDSVVHAFSNDGRLTGTTGVTATGQKAIRDMMTQIYARHREAGMRMKHLYANTVLDVEGEVAHATSDIVVYQRIGDGDWDILMVGTVVDRLTREEGRWLFAERRVTNDRR